MLVARVLQVYLTCTDIRVESLAKGREYEFCVLEREETTDVEYPSRPPMSVLNVKLPYARTEDAFGPSVSSLSYKHTPPQPHLL